ncbi:uncharacterized protein [Dermacentor andersoni]|uniref:uncharacterized protein n=1 Tax=Dermacentor andersoni TaxID=34620 RepID=UPI00241729ED|nr:PR domain zinc finger protein 12-like [Dermacentor andersoni]
MNATAKQQAPVVSPAGSDHFNPSATTDADLEANSPKKARSDDHEPYIDATIVETADMEAEDRSLTTVTYKKSRQAGIPMIFKLTDPEASFWKAYQEPSYHRPVTPYAPCRLPRPRRPVCPTPTAASSCLPEEQGELLKALLYGRWISWGGKRPPPAVEATILSTVPPGVVAGTPRQLRLGVSSVPGCQVGVFAADHIPKDTQMGPYPGAPKPALALCRDPALVWEAIDGASGRVRFFVDGADAVMPSWMTYVQCARHEQEQNLDMLLLLHEGSLYYRVTKAIHPDEELLVWYDGELPHYMGIPDALLPSDTPVKEKPQDGSSGSRSCVNGSGSSIYGSSTASSGGSGRLKCVVCRRGFNSRSNLRSHMRTHTLEKPFACKFCGRSFSQSSTLRNHLRLHTGERPYKCLVCQRAYSQLAGLRAHQRSARHRPQSGAPPGREFGDEGCGRDDVRSRKGPLPELPTRKEQALPLCRPQGLATANALHSSLLSV